MTTTPGSVPPVPQWQHDPNHDGCFGPVAALGETCFGCWCYGCGGWWASPPPDRRPEFVAPEGAPAADSHYWCFVSVSEWLELRAAGKV